MGILGTPIHNYDSPYQETDFFVLYHSLDASSVVLLTLCFCLLHILQLWDIVIWFLMIKQEIVTYFNVLIYFYDEPLIYNFYF